MNVRTGRKERLATQLLAIVGLSIGIAAPCHGAATQGADTVAAASASRWIPTGSLRTARAGHTATLLQDGRVLVAGACDGRTVEAELYDPATGRWSPGGSMRHPRCGHTATLLPNGQVLVAGDYDTVVGRTAELYDPTTNTWSDTGDMNEVRAEHTATLLGTGKVLAVGGVTHGRQWILWHAETYDPALGTWTRTRSMNSPRAGHSATLLRDGSVLVAGGYDDPFGFLARAEIYDPLADKWRDTAGVGAAGWGHTATPLSSGQVLFIGGEAPVALPVPTQLFDPATQSVEYTAAPAEARLYHTATRLADGNVLMVGGYQPVGDPFWDHNHRDVGSAEVYDAAVGQWTSAGTLATPRSGHTATLLRDGRVLVVGGRSAVDTAPGDPLASAELYTGMAPGTIGPGHTGVWYDPAQDGHYLILQVLSDDRLLAAWLTFAPDGKRQAWFGGVGTYRGNTATVTEVYQTTGGRWTANLEPAPVRYTPWGTLTFTFTDCNHGRVDFDSTAGFGRGSMNLTRLTLPDGLACP